MLHRLYNNYSTKYLHERCLQLIIMKNLHLMKKIYEPRMDQLLFITKISRVLLSRYMFKVENNVVREIVNDVPYNEIVNHYGLRHLRYFRKPLVHWVYYGSNSIESI